MLEALKQRTVVIGNAGSGKSALAASLAAWAHVPVVDLDLLHWENDGRGPKRDEEAAKLMVRDAGSGPRWIIEGVYGWLAEVALPRATALIWLDLPWSICHEGLLARGLRRGGTEAEFAELLTWAKDYWDRQTSSSFTGHLRLFESFPEAKTRLRTREAVNELLARMSASASN